MQEEPIFEKISEDKRGANYRIILPGKRELVLIFTRAGYWRGGHFHDADEVALMLRGKMEYFKRTADGKDLTFEVSKGQSYENKAGEPHVGHFLEDSWLLDWKIDACIGEFTTTDYEPYRARVRSQK